MIGLFGYEIPGGSQNRPKLRVVRLERYSPLKVVESQIVIPDESDLPDDEDRTLSHYWQMSISDLDSDYPEARKEARKAFASWHAQVWRRHKRSKPSILQCGRRFTAGNIINLVDSVLFPSETR